MLGFIIGMLILGLIAGAVARLLVPGEDPMGIGGTILLGVIGSFVGGFFADVLFRNDAEDLGLRPSSLIGSIVGGVIVLLLYRRFAGGRTRGRLA